jgi:CheY-like chemotaxis protein
MSVLENKNILIIEKNEATCAMIANQLSQWKMIPHIAASEQEAMKIISANKSISLVLIDQEIAEKGESFAKAILMTSPDLPVINMRYPSEQSAANGATILYKPVRQNLLRDKIISLLLPPATENKVNTEANLTEFSKHYPLRILVAEDNAINRKIAEKVLNKLGYTPDMVNDGHEAMEQVSLEAYDVILMDVQMPGMNGLEATRMIRSCLDAQPVIIALTANVMHGDRDECMQAGMDDYMSKPIAMKELVDQLEKWGQVVKERKRA